MAISLLWALSASLLMAQTIADEIFDARTRVDFFVETLAQGNQSPDELTQVAAELAEIQTFGRECVESSYGDLDEMAGELTSQFHTTEKQQLSACQALRDSAGLLLADLDILVKLETVQGYKREFEDRPEERQQLKTRREEITQIRSLGRACIEKAEKDLLELGEELEVLGPTNAEETDTLKKARDSLDRKQSKLKKKLDNCKVLQLESESLLDAIAQLEEKELADRLAVRSPSVPSLIISRDVLNKWFTAIRNLRIRRTGLGHLNTVSTTTLALLTFGLLMIATLARRRLRPRLPAQTAPEHRTLAMMTSLASATLHYLPALLVSAGWAVFWLIVAGHELPWPLITVVSLALTAYLIIITLTRALFRPVAPAQHFLPFDPDSSRRYGRAFRRLVLVAAVGTAVFLSPFDENLPGPILYLARTSFVTILVFALIRVVWLAFTLGKIQGVGLFRPLITLALLVGLVAEWFGFHNLSIYIVAGIAFSLIGGTLAGLLSYLVTDLLDGLDQGRYGWEQKARRQLGITGDRGLPGIIWLRLICAIAIWGSLILFLLRVWGLSAKGQAALVLYLSEGFEAGPLKIVPLQIGIGLLLFAVLLSTVSWLKKQLDTRWLAKTRIDRGAREASVTVSGYVGIAIAAVIALSVAGVDFKNVALIAGALSVGIGFGLQNIVNNFVSGLILLFERPIRTGDWIVVGNTEGYVKNISIRSTQILTFDRANVIVPNSQLIADQVTNWTLRDLRGRVKIHVGVAYGSDTQKVKDILLGAANEHSSVITNGSLPPPRVFFLGFGDSSLDFQLAFFVTEIEYRKLITSDINFALDAAFREAGVEIPFPQRDVNLRSSRPLIEPPGEPSGQAREESTEKLPEKLPDELSDQTPDKSDDD